MEAINHIRIFALFIFGELGNWDVGHDTGSDHHIIAAEFAVGGDIG